jgi:multiple sugar transport system ATP-binding protein
MASVEFDCIGKVYPNGTHAVVDYTMEVQDGEIVVFVGPSGCGKSTLLRLTAGLEEPTTGTLRIGSRPVNGLPPQQRNVAMVFQDYALYPHLSVRGNLEFPLKMRKLPRDEIRRRVDWAVELLGMVDWLDRLPKELSGGQRQRAAMGRALVRDPTVFLLDEPLSNLDAKLRVQVRTEIGELQRRTGTTMIYVTHDQVEAMTLGARIAVIHQGRLQQVSSPRDLYERPANTFVAGFIGSPPMNVFGTRLTLDADGGTMVTIGDQTVAAAPAHVSAARVRPWVGRALSAGVRPEAFRLVGSGVAGAVTARVEELEYLGHETLLYVRPGRPAAGDGGPVVARLPGMLEAAKGDVVHLQIDSRQIYLFDDMGKALAD